jgi:hypothetical protein
LLEHGEWQSLLQNKFLLILLLRQQNLELLVLFWLYLFAIVSVRSSSAPEMAASAACQPAIPLHVRQEVSWSSW